MSIALEELKELTRIEESLRQHANTLEFCSSCQRISECQHYCWKWRTPVWLCNDCWEKSPFSQDPETKEQSEMASIAASQARSLAEKRRML